MIKSGIFVQQSDKVHIKIKRFAFKMELNETLFEHIKVGFQDCVYLSVEIIKRFVCIHCGELNGLCKLSLRHNYFRGGL